MVEVLQKSKVYWNSLPHPQRVNSKLLLGVLTGVGLVVGIAGMVSSIGGPLTAPVSAAFSGAAHVTDRVKNHVVKSNEQEFRAKYYSTQIFRRLGIDAAPGQEATVEQFRLAAARDPEMNKLYQAAINEESNENRSSMMMNTGVAVASAVIPFGGVVAGVAEVGRTAIEASHAVRIAKGMLPVVGAMLGGVGGSALSQVLNHTVLDSQKLIEAMELLLLQAQQQGINPSQVLRPHLVFALRVSQDPTFAEQIKKQFGDGKVGFHQMDDAQQDKVMRAFPALANAATVEAHSVAMGNLSIRELAAMRPNLNSRAAEYALGTRNATYAGQATPMSFAERLGNKNATPSFTTAIDAQRQAAAQNLNTVSN